MSFITTTAPEAATGDVAALYRQLQGSGDYLPNYARTFCHRPGLMAHISDTMKALRAPMNDRLWLLVNLAAARACGSSYCSLAFAKKLISKYLSEREVLAIVSEGHVAALSGGEREAMAYAAKLARNAAAVEQADIDALKRQGFTDAEVFDIAAAAAWRCFFARVPDALGARPDQALGQMEKSLLERLLVGRPLEGGTDAGKVTSQAPQTEQGLAEQTQYTGTDHSLSSRVMPNTGWQGEAP